MITNFRAPLLPYLKCSPLTHVYKLNSGSFGYAAPPHAVADLDFIRDNWNIFGTNICLQTIAVTKQVQQSAN